jgi:hypothetical protein
MTGRMRSARASACRLLTSLPRVQPRASRRAPSPLSLLPSSAARLVRAPSAPGRRRGLRPVIPWHNFRGTISRVPLSSRYWALQRSRRRLDAGASDRGAASGVIDQVVASCPRPAGPTFYLILIKASTAASCLGKWSRSLNVIEYDQFLRPGISSQTTKLAGAVAGRSERRLGPDTFSLSIQSLPPFRLRLARPNDLHEWLRVGRRSRAQRRRDRGEYAHLNSWIWVLRCCATEDVPRERFP